MKKKLTLRQYYKTQHWIDLHKKWVYTDETECEICHCKRYGFYKVGKKKGQRKPKAENHIHIHHKHYNSMFKEERGDVMILCDSCHKLGHMLEDMKGRSDLYKQMHEDFKIKTGWEFKKR